MPKKYTYLFSELLPQVVHKKKGTWCTYHGKTDCEEFMGGIQKGQRVKKSKKAIFGSTFEFLIIYCKIVFVLNSCNKYKKQIVNFQKGKMMNLYPLSASYFYTKMQTNNQILCLLVISTSRDT